MGRTYFISDVHLGAKQGDEENKNRKRFLDFLASIEDDAERIFFVGDLFDFWFEYKFAIPKHHFDVLHQLAKFRDKNIPMVYLAGNHDFWLGEFFDRELNMETVNDEWCGEIDGKQVYLFHGDGVAKKDVGYRILKKILRNKTNIHIFRWLHPDLGFPLSRYVSGTSRHYTNHIVLNDHTDYIDFARDRFAEGYDYVIMGHRHNPFEHDENGRKYVNLGDWLFNFSYATMENGELTLRFHESS